jgi:hypothetical protein
MGMSVEPNLTAVARSQAKESDLVAKFPDLDQEDRSLVKTYFDAFVRQGSRPDRYHGAKNSLIARIKQLQSSITLSCRTTASALKMIGRLINLNGVLWMTRVSAGQYLARSYYSEQVSEPRECSRPSGANALPEEIKVLLDAGEGGETALAYYNRHVCQLFFVTSLKSVIKLFDSDRFNGANEPGTRTVIVDTWKESSGRSYEPWELAAVIIHETAHIDYTYRFADDPDRQKIDRSERFAHLVTREYLANLLDQRGFTEETRQEIKATYREITERIDALNLKLGLRPSDYLSKN